MVILFFYVFDVIFEGRLVAYPVLRLLFFVKDPTFTGSLSKNAVHLDNRKWLCLKQSCGNEMLQHYRRKATCIIPTYLPYFICLLMLSSDETQFTPGKIPGGGY